MESRLLTPNERMTDAFDRASTLNFTTVARVHSARPTSPDDVRAALRKLERRHPLLRAALRRAGKRSRLELSRAAEIPLTVHEGPYEDWRALVEQTLVHRSWSEDGPRAELLYLRQGPRDFTLLLCLHHVISDGSSGIYAMRDLLALIADPQAEPEPLPSPGLDAFLPRGVRGFASYLRAALLFVRATRRAKPYRLSQRSQASVEQRAARLSRLALPRDPSLSLARRARADGVTVHGVLCAALACAVAERAAAASTKRAGQPTPERILHPVCMRRYLRELAAPFGTPGEAVGCYVSSVETQHAVDPGAGLAPIAREVCAQLKQKKRDREPLLNAPLMGPLLTDYFADVPPAKLAELCERKLMLNTVSLSNLGRLESLGARESVGTLEVDELFFVAAGSVFSALGASATSFRGQLSLVLCGVEPLIAADELAALSTRVEGLLHDYAHDHEPLRAPIPPCL